MARIIQEHLQRHPDILERTVVFLAAMSWNQS